MKSEILKSETTEQKDGQNQKKKKRRQFVSSYYTKGETKDIFELLWIEKWGIIELFVWLFSKKFVYQSKFSMFF